MEDFREQEKLFWSYFGLNLNQETAPVGELAVPKNESHPVMILISHSSLHHGVTFTELCHTVCSSAQLLHTELQDCAQETAAIKVSDADLRAKTIVL